MDSQSRENMIQLKDWGRPDEILVEKHHSLPKGPKRMVQVFVTQIVYVEYLRREQAWVMRDPHRITEILHHPNDKGEPPARQRIALFVNCVSPKCTDVTHRH